MPQQLVNAVIQNPETLNDLGLYEIDYQNEENFYQAIKCFKAKGGKACFIGENRKQNNDKSLKIVIISNEQLALRTKRIFLV